MFQPHSVTKAISLTSRVCPHIHCVPPVLLCVPSTTYPTVNAARHLSKPELTEASVVLWTLWFLSEHISARGPHRPAYLPPPCPFSSHSLSDADELLSHLGRCRGSLRVRWSPPILWGSGQESVRCGSHPLCWNLLESLVSCEWAPCQGGEGPVTISLNKYKSLLGHVFRAICADQGS